MQFGAPAYACVLHNQINGPNHLALLDVSGILNWSKIPYYSVRHFQEKLNKYLQDKIKDKKSSEKFFLEKYIFIIF